MNNDKLTPFHTIGHDIKVALDNGAIGGALILTYAAIDAMAFLSMPENKNEVQGEDFINWVEKYMKTDSKQPYQYQGIDLWGARCGIVHRYGATSSLSDSGKCNFFGYHNGSEHMVKPSVDERFIVISWPRFINDFFGAMKKFLTDIMKDEELKKKVASRIVHLFYVSPI
ncbi:MAG: hypothetical protein GH144_09575 [Clostridia bacterium]|nr:hypothetical protein [Clostridia bacterium]